MWPFKKKTLEDYLSETKKVKIGGIEFKIRRLQTTDHLQGYQVMQKVHDLYQLKKNLKTKAAGLEEQDLENLKKVQKYCRDIVLAGCVDPKFSIKAEDAEPGTIPIDKILGGDFYIAQRLTEHILLFTYKKK